MLTSSPPDSIQALVPKILAAPRSGRRRLIALSGAPASGKSTLAETLSKALNAAGCPTQTVPMDGFHLDNQILKSRGLLPRKGAPETFDAPGFLHLVSRLSGEPEVFYPLFDRPRDIAIAGAGLLNPTCDTVIIEGNYLLFDAPIWRDLAPHWDLSIRLNTPIETLRDRLVTRWENHGLSPTDALARAEENDLPNARRIASAQLPADLEV